jgi:hypothetical protein
MQASNQPKQHYFYLWQKRILLDNDQIVTRTCFGITSDFDNRRNNYEGANGHAVEFCDLWLGPYRPIKELESRLKAVFSEQLVTGFRNFKYEWVNETVPYEQIKAWVEWELENHPTIVRHEIATLQD